MPASRYLTARHGLGRCLRSAGLRKSRRPRRSAARVCRGPCVPTAGCFCVWGAGVPAAVFFGVFWRPRRWLFQFLGSSRPRRWLFAFLLCLGPGGPPAGCLFFSEGSLRPRRWLFVMFSEVFWRPRRWLVFGSRGSCVPVAGCLSFRGPRVPAAGCSSSSPRTGFGGGESYLRRTAAAISRAGEPLFNCAPRARALSSIGGSSEVASPPPQRCAGV